MQKMEYRHTPPTLTEMREFRNRVSRYLKKKTKEKQGIFGGKDKEGEKSEFDLTLEELIHYELDVIMAHLENQNEILLEITRKFNR